jgi:hypothetical protein
MKKKEKQLIRDSCKRVLATRDLSSVSLKDVRRLIEADLKRDENSLDGEEKKAVNCMIKKCVQEATDDNVEEEAPAEEEEEEEAPAAAEEQADGVASDSASASDSESEEEKPQKKRARKAVKEEEDDGKPKKPFLGVTTITGKVAPKQLNKVQANLMTASQFEKKAENLIVDIGGNILEGEARSFTSGNKGWYLGGKIQVKVGNKLVWAQAGLNVTLCGSKEW